MIDYNNFYLILSIIPIPILSRHSGDCSAIRTQNSVTTKKTMWIEERGRIEALTIIILCRIVKESLHVHGMWVEDHSKLVK
jgi:hypothetical protein